MILSLRKIFKALNSGAHNWQLSLAIILALFSGFLPFNGILAIIILLIALILNVNFSLYLLFTAVFAAIGYLLDPLFERIGYGILNSPSLAGLFTTLYNIPLLRWTSYNYSLVPGSLAISCLLALPGFFILNRFILLYRQQLGVRLNTWKMTAWMNLFQEEEDKKTSLFRWWGAGIFGTLMVGMLVFSMVFFDSLAKCALERGLSYSLQRQVDVDGFNSSFSDLSCLINGVAISDPDNLSQNQLVIQSVGFDLAFAPLLEKKLQIDLLRADGISFNTPRKTPAKPYSREKSLKTESPASEKAAASPFGTDLFKVPSIDDVLSSEQLASVEEAKKLRADVARLQEKWLKIEADLRSGKDIDQIRSEAAQLQKSFETADLAALATLKNDVTSLNTKVQDLQAKYTTLSNDFSKDQQEISQRINRLQTLPQEDVARLKKKYTPDLSGGANILSALLGEKMGGYIHRGLAYYEMAKPYLNDASKQAAKSTPPPRGEGRWVAYANYSTIPRAVIVRGLFGIELANDLIEIDMQHFSTNQKLYGKPMTLHGDAQGQSYKKLSLDLIDDRRTSTPTTSFAVNIEDFVTKEFTAEGVKLTDMTGSITAEGKIIDTVVQGKAKAIVKKVKISMASQQMLNDLLAGVNSFSINADFKGAIDSPEIALSTDLDKQLAAGFTNMAGKATENFEAELMQGIQKKFTAENQGINGELGDIDKLLASSTGELGGINTSFTSDKTTDKVKGFLGF